jgi:hypothetical protein
MDWLGDLSAVEVDKTLILLWLCGEVVYYGGREDCFAGSLATAKPEEGFLGVFPG